MTDLKTIDGETLISQPLQPLNFVVDTLISQGLHILAGSPKIGKSWLVVGRLHGLRPHRQAPGCSAETVKPPEGLTPKQREKWLNEQAVLFERECKDTPLTVDKATTLAQYVQLWLRDIAPDKLAKSTLAYVESSPMRWRTVFLTILLPN